MFVCNFFFSLVSILYYFCSNAPCEPHREDPFCKPSPIRPNPGLTDPRQWEYSTYLYRRVSSSLGTSVERTADPTPVYAVGWAAFLFSR